MNNPDRDAVIADVCRELVAATDTDRYSLRVRDAVLSEQS